MLADMPPKEVSRYLLEQNETSPIRFSFQSGHPMLHDYASFLLTLHIPILVLMFVIYT